MSEKHSFISLPSDLKRDFTSCRQVPRKVFNLLRASVASLQVMIHSDGTGDGNPLPVECVLNKTSGIVSTVIHHSMENARISKAMRPWEAILQISFIRAEPLHKFPNWSMKQKKCQQFVKYECHGASSLNGYWKDRFGQIMKQWSSGNLSTTASTSCQSGRPCNCEKNDLVWRSDEAFITDKKHLPITAVHFGDTGHPAEELYHTVGPLVCH